MNKCLMDTLSDLRSENELLKAKIRFLQKELEIAEQRTDSNSNDITDLHLSVVTNYETASSIEKDNMALLDATAQLYELITQLTPAEPSDQEQP